MARWQVEGESLYNDGVAIVLFNIFRDQIILDESAARLASPPLILHLAPHSSRLGHFISAWEHTYPIRFLRIMRDKVRTEIYE